MKVPRRSDFAGAGATSPPKMPLGKTLIETVDQREKPQLLQNSRQMPVTRQNLPETEKTPRPDREFTIVGLDMKPLQGPFEGQAGSPEGPILSRIGDVDPADGLKRFQGLIVGDFPTAKAAAPIKVHCQARFSHNRFPS